LNTWSFSLNRHFHKALHFEVATTTTTTTTLGPLPLFPFRSQSLKLSSSTLNEEPISRPDLVAQGFTIYSNMPTLFFAQKLVENLSSKE
jgi:hypothetical protein